MPRIRLKKYVQPEIKALKKLLKSWLISNTTVPNLLRNHYRQYVTPDQPLHHASLMLAVFKSIQPATMHVGHNCLTICAIVELLHAAILLHDQIQQIDHIDHGEMHMPASSNARHILHGDLLYATALQLMLSLQQPQLLPIFATTTHRMAQGELHIQQLHLQPEDAANVLLQFNLQKYNILLTNTLPMFAPYLSDAAITADWLQQIGALLGNIIYYYHYHRTLAKHHKITYTWSNVLAYVQQLAVLLIQHLSTTQTDTIVDYIHTNLMLPQPAIFHVPAVSV